MASAGSTECSTCRYEPSASRALHYPDAFPAGDLGVRKALGGVAAAAARARSGAWRSWRAYAVAHLWARLALET